MAAWTTTVLIHFVVLVFVIGVESFTGSADYRGAYQFPTATAQYESYEAEESKDNELFTLLNSSGEQITTQHELGLLLYKGGTVCDDYFDYNAADAVCKQMNFARAETGKWFDSMYIEESFAIREKYEIKLHDVWCPTANWDSCSYMERHIDCLHSEDVILSCSHEGLFTLVDSEKVVITTGDQLGLLLYRGGTVCDDHFNDTAADAICKHLNFRRAEKWTVRESFDIQSEYRITLDDVQCGRAEWNYCQYSESDWRDISSSCSHSDNVFLSCTDTARKKPLFSLVDAEGSNITAGEQLGLLLYKGGTVCDDYFDDNAANAICKDMNFDYATEWSIGKGFDIEKSYEIKLDNVKCSSADWKNCSFSEEHNCAHDEDVYLICYKKLFSLVDSRGVEIEGEQLGLLLYLGGTVCDDFFNVTAAGAICRQMNFKHAIRWSHEETFDIQTNYDLALDDVQCGDFEWARCSYLHNSAENNCDHDEDVFISCSSSEVELFTLVDSNGAAVEGEELGLLLYKGGTVCDDRFNITAAEAICKQLQFDGAKEWTIAERFDIQTDYDINLSNVECSSEEWESCTFTKGDICSHREDVFLSCRHANSSGKKTWRDDGKCGREHRLSDGNPAQCDPDGKNPCCSDKLYGECGRSKDHCLCEDCTNYNRIHSDWKTSGGTQKWRYDGLCDESSFALLPDGSLAPAECDPDGDSPCCNANGRCTSGVHNCFCSDCVDYRLVRTVRQSISNESCVLSRLFTGYLKHVCFDEVDRIQSFKCAQSELHYELDINHQSAALESFSARCKDDPQVYQACGFGTQVTNTDVLCGCHVSEGRNNNRADYDCTRENCRSSHLDCGTSHRAVDKTLCDDKCDLPDCKDESVCNGQEYGVLCRNWAGGDMYVPVYMVCDGGANCDDGSDEHGCSVTNSDIDTCTQYFSKVVLDKMVTVPILNKTRCSIVDESKAAYPYCLDYKDQTNCSDIERVGGYCELNGYPSTVSKYMVCYGYESKTKLSVHLCDDGSEDNCINPSSSDCLVHKHRMCDGIFDCPDESDERHDMCDTMAESFNCSRRFNPEYSNISIPESWIIDNEIDCMNAEDEDTNAWESCPGNTQIKFHEYSCQDVYKCQSEVNKSSSSGHIDTTMSKLSVPFDQLCDGVESCENGKEQTVCQQARDFPIIDREAPNYNETFKSVCEATSNAACKPGLFRRPRGSVFGVSDNIKLIIPTSKIDCSELFGEQYIFLSCMNLCLEDVKCPLDDQNEELKYNSCPGQYPHRSYTLGNNSFLTFVDKSEEGKYHQDVYQCNNSKCVDYKQVCDLVDDCGDMSDEINCTNHMICEDTLNSGKYQFIPRSHKCDGVYDCFDLSDECNDSCTKHILENWFLKIFCWIMGILAILLNLFNVIRGVTSIKDCVTVGMMTSKVLIILIGCGDLLIGIYLVSLSVYDSVIFGDTFCGKQADWLTGAPCLILGVMSTVGSQLSLFSMTVMSCIRVYGIKLMRISRSVNKRAVGKVTLAAMLIIASSLVIALIPLVPSLEDFFVQGMYYDPKYKVFIGFPNKDRHMRVLNAYDEQDTGNVSLDLSWKEIGEKVDGMFTQNYGNLTRRPVHFYGNDGVCLFKYFVRANDARRSRYSPGSGAKTNDPVVWTMLAVNLICFLVITLCYIAIISHTQQSSKRSGQVDNPVRSVEERAVQRRVMMIIATDFLCWVPFIFISGMHNLEYIDASAWYVTFAMIVLPLNSVINPLIYDKALNDFVRRKFNDTTSAVSTISGRLSKMSATATTQMELT